MDVTAFVPFFILIIVPATAWTIFRHSSRVRRPLLRILIKVTTASAGVVGAASLLFFSLFEASCTRHASPIKSPDGRYIAIIDYALQGALGDDYANVGIRHSWSPRAQNVYQGIGAWDFKNARPFDPEVRWLDSTHLLIRYGQGRPACRNSLDEIEIVCQPLR